MSADLDALVALMPFAGQLGLALDEAGADRVVARLDWAPHLCTTAGVLHGGVLMSLADSAGALVAFLGLPEGKTTATITSTSHMFRPVTGGTERAEAGPAPPRPTPQTPHTPAAHPGGGREAPPPPGQARLHTRDRAAPA